MITTKTKRLSIRRLYFIAQPQNWLVLRVVAEQVDQAREDEHEHDVEHDPEHHLLEDSTCSRLTTRSRSPTMIVGTTREVIWTKGRADSIRGSSPKKEGDPLELFSRIVFNATGIPGGCIATVMTNPSSRMLPGR